MLVLWSDQSVFCFFWDGLRARPTYQNFKASKHVDKFGQYMNFGGTSKYCRGNATVLEQAPTRHKWWAIQEWSPVIKGIGASTWTMTALSDHFAVLVRMA
jgi:hypothetical protein